MVTSKLQLQVSILRGAHTGFAVGLIVLTVEPRDQRGKTTILNSDQTGLCKKFGQVIQCSPGPLLKSVWIWKMSFCMSFLSSVWANNLLVSVNYCISLLCVAANVQKLLFSVVSFSILWKLQCCFRDFSFVRWQQQYELWLARTHWLCCMCGHFSQQRDKTLQKGEHGQ